MFFFFFFNDTATTEIYTLSLHDALPILISELRAVTLVPGLEPMPGTRERRGWLPAGACKPVLGDRKSTRLNSSHHSISYAVFCLKKKKLLYFEMSDEQDDGSVRDRSQA